MTVLNVTGKERCAFCGNDGLVIVDTGDPFDEEWAKLVRGMSLDERRKRGLFRCVYGDVMAPCPYCEQGIILEFPEPDPKTRRSRAGKWGKDGYWQGKPPVELRPVETGAPLPLEENRRRMRELAGRMGVVLQDMPS